MVFANIWKTSELGCCFRQKNQNVVFDSKFGSTTPADLWRALTESTTVLPTSVSVIMDNWTYKAGYPVLQVKRNGDDVVVTQVREQFEKLDCRLRMICRKDS